MIFINLTQASQGEQRATDNAFKNYNALLAADARTTRANEFNAGADGRLAAIQLENDRQVGLAAGLAPDLQSIIDADINQIQGAAAQRNVAGLLAQETAGSQLPNIPALSSNAAGTQLANSNNTNFNATVLTPQTQAINENINTNTLAQQPAQFALETGRNNQALALQEGEKQYALAKQTYDQAVLNGQAKNLPYEQALQRQRIALDSQRTAYNSGVVTQQQSVLPTQNAIQNQQLEGQLARSPLEQAQLDSQQRTATGEAQYTEQQQTTLQGIRTQQTQILQSATSFEALTQPQRQQLEQLQLQYNQVRQQGLNTRQPLQETVAATQVAGQVARADSVQRTENANQVVREGNARYSAQNLTAQQDILTKVQRIRQKAVDFEALTQDDRQEISRLTNQYNSLRAQTQVDLQPGQANVAKTQQELAQLEADTNLNAQPDVATLSRITRDIQLGDLQFEQLQAPVRQAIARDQALVQQANMASTLRFVPKATRIKEMQLGQDIYALESGRKLQGYAYEASEIKAKGQPAAAQAALNEQTFRNQVLQGTRAIQRLNTLDPRGVSASQLALTTRTLRDNELMLDNQTLSTGPQGILIKTPGQADRPLSQLLQSLTLGTQKAQDPKPTVYTNRTYATDTGVVNVPQVVTHGAPPTAADQAWVDSLVGTQQTNPANAFIGAPAAQQIQQNNAGARGF